jgi:hypothetical protein
MADGDSGRFRSTELAFRVSGTDFVVDCGATGGVPEALCGQNTAKTLELSLDGNLERLITDLRAVLADLEDLESDETPSPE